MALLQWKKDQVIHQEGDPVKELEIVISGRIRMKKGALPEDFSSIKKAYF